MAVDILTQIVANKRIELQAQMQIVSESQLEASLGSVTPCRSLSGALRASRSGIISEFKRKSPSKGWIHQHINPQDVVPLYAQAGASAVSILTDEKYFGGSLADIVAVRDLVPIPILRKDFIISRYQLLQAKQVGADAVLLIAAVLTRQECATLTNQAHELGLEVLLETHSLNELAYVTPEIDVVGVNNRNLGSFVTCVDNSFSLARALPQDKVLVSESGISSVEVIKRLQGVGFKGFLIGEAFMKEEQPHEKLREFIQQIEQ